ncbi:MAG: primosomal protein N' [Acidobacteria bacterium]|nr:primosomal protein N' [Acidobacteriota bacterium]
MSGGLLVPVAVPVPFLGALTYRVPAGMAPPPPGVRVRVPLASRVVTGCVLPAAALDARGGEVETRELVECLDDGPFLPDAVLELTAWIAEYYACGAGDAVAAAMPPFAWTRRAAAGRRGASAFRTVRIVRLTPAGDQMARTGPPATIGPRQRGALALLAAAPGGLAAAELAAYGIAADTVRRLAGRGLVAVERRQVERDPFAAPDWVDDADGAGPIELTAEQQAALRSLTAWTAEGRFRVALLHGVTGSGKTAVYLQLAGHVRRQGRRVLVLVPEIALTPAVVGAFHAACRGRVAIQHSGLSNGERHDQWHRIRRGDVDVVVGTRSAVFAPLDNLGLIIVDEEHDASYKQEESPRYHGRDVAVMRGKQAGALVVLGSATPSMETYHNAATGRYERIVLRKRVFDRPLPSVSVVDMRDEVAEHGPDVVLSTALRTALAARLERGEQALVLLNRRGFAAAVLCRQCGQSVACPNCSVSLTLYRQADRVRCHYCGYAARRPAVCPHCAGPFLERVGVGTERIESEAAGLFPTATVARLDRDTARRRGAAQRILQRFARHDIDILVGTQMVAKGHDFPAVTLVGVVSADVGLGLADFRAAERTFQLLAQVAGRAGRGDRPGEAIVQTFHPGHYSIEHACRQAYEPFFDAEMRFRRSMRYPPLVAMVNVVVRAETFARAMEEAAGLVADMRRPRGGYEVLGPAPAPLTRLKGEHRAQIFLKGARRRALRAAVQAALERRPALRRRVTVDVDPLSVR